MTLPGTPTANVGSSTGPLTDKSGTVTAGGAAQTIHAETSSRRYFFLQNTSAGVMWLNFGTTATNSQPSIKIPAGAVMEYAGSFVPGDLASLWGTTTGDTFVCKVG